MLALGQKSSDNQIGRYQTTGMGAGNGTGSVWVADTTTGESKIVYFTRGTFTVDQAGKPFSQMKEKLLIGELVFDRTAADCIKPRAAVAAKPALRPTSLFLSQSTSCTPPHQASRQLPRDSPA